jgi:hypothetical protein
LCLDDRRRLGFNYLRNWLGSLLLFLDLFGLSFFNLWLRKRCGQLSALNIEDLLESSLASDLRKLVFLLLVV